MGGSHNQPPRSGEATILKSLCVFCGSSFGTSLAYRQAAERLGEEIDQTKEQLAAGTKAKADKAELKKLEARLKDLQSDRLSTLQVAMGVGDVDSPEDCHVLVRGEIGERGERVPRGMVSAVRVARPIEIGSSHSGRLELARWLTDPSNPLTPRVAVNRVWRHLFGRGLVPTVDNFGANGDKPSHPELLDSLAVRFVEDGWSVKRLIRGIVLSRAYRLAGDFDARNHTSDPENALVWRMSPRRLDAESLRDAMLSASGQLSRTPPDRTGPTSIATIANANDILRRLDNNPFPFRSVYLPIAREQVPEMLELFDFADPSLVVGQRSATNVPAQSLYLMNSPFVLEQSDGVAKRVLAATDVDDSGRVQLANKLCLSRPASDQEVANALTFIQRMDQRLYEAVPKLHKRRPIAWASYCQTLFGSAEFRYQD